MTIAGIGSGGVLPYAFDLDVGQLVRNVQRVVIPVFFLIAAMDLTGVDAVDCIKLCEASKGNLPVWTLCMMGCAFINGAG